MKKEIRTIPVLPQMPRLSRVAAYARVSSGKDAMLHSLSAQVEYYSSMIEQHAGWVFAGVYADEALTGTKEDRMQFQRMLHDCREGRIDQILTKSISRFARNTVTLLETVRELRNLGIDVYFEEQNIHSISGDGELMLTVLASYAQEESRSASENQKWRIRNGFAQGELMNLRFLYGYRISKERGVEIDPKEAKTVREIFRRIVHGDSINSVIRWLNRTGIRGALGGKWTIPRLRELITNEKYTGNALLQKTYVNNHIDKRKMKNCGELPQYFCTETHPAIIDSETFEAAQKAIMHIQETKPQQSPRQQHIFTGMIVCSICGKTYRFIKCGGKARWACATYLRDGKAFCPSRKIPEDVLIRLSCDSLGMKSFDETLFRQQISRIVAGPPNILTFHLKSGEEKETRWENQSRKESWTPEMRLKAAEHARRRWHG